MFYDADILEEKVLLEWAGKVSRKYVSRDLSQEIHTKAEPFIKWLKEAEEEDDTDSVDGEDAEDDLEVLIHSIGMCRIQFLAILRSLFRSSLLRTFSCHPSPLTIRPSSLT
jgi:hypothetical protein